MTNKEIKNAISFSEELINDGDNIIHSIIHDVTRKSPPYKRSKLSKLQKEYILAILKIQKQHRRKIKELQFLLNLDNNQVFSFNGGGRYNLNELELEDLQELLENYLNILKAPNKGKNYKKFVVEISVLRIKKYICKKKRLTCFKNKIMSKFARK